jgi:hypothetical protein
MILGLLPM